MKKIMLVLLLVLTAVSVNAQVMTENFEYITGQLTDYNTGANVSGGNWVHFSGTGVLIQVTSGSLTYDSYPASNIGNKIEIVSPTVSAEDAYRQFTSQLPEANVYISFLLNLPNTTGLCLNTSTDGDYFVALLPDNSTSNYVARFIIKAGSASDTYWLGLRASSSNTSSWHQVDLNVGTTYMIVLGYNLISASGDEVKLWINPILTGSEPAADITQTSVLDAPNIARFAVRQGYVIAGQGTPNASIDGIIVGNTWNDITGVEGQPSIAPVNFSLLPCLPNPANKSTKFSFSLSQNAKVELSVFNVLGQKVVTLYKGSLASGQHTINWNLKDAQDRLLPNGVYFYQLTDGSRNSTRRLLILK